mmetsp:Transcript_35888/g.61565  ORF Transcript_35888/g.61565 Transcript_35888/m.61565 type:complete len:375 (+) Transcript_35888:392-1516(+)|eukprot:CAMPEP_0206157926 /NCGR_PEP_ID=MMETSP1474-20131121/4363_1 /ASSEMBLY_ACC=CAM_ASM_001110 /TAXON_ID=97495 /ORGANISM="Imantonia sp., Strain RCC918" /LENGTH=374 /DNA_ID=CAMNT_0053557739 /DNA_START=344 /DNA_END=1468 /DNA_ORIENTATION=+
MAGRLQIRFMPNDNCNTKLLAAICLASVSLCVAPKSLLAPPKVWIHELEALNAMPVNGKPVDAKAAYLNALSSLLTSSSMECDPSVADEAVLSCLRPLRFGLNWPKVGVTMAGHMRLTNIKELLLQVHTSGVKGSYLEAGVWRGGMSIFATAVVETYQLGRTVYLCDSFEGLPPPRPGSLRADETVYRESYDKSLSMGEAHVADNFHMYGVPTKGVHFVKGFFVDSLPGLREQLIARNESLSVLRMDGDMYDSTIDILYNLYDLVSVGGYIVIDDFGWTHGTLPHTHSVWGAKDAVLDFRAVHGIEDLAHAMRDIDGSGAWFQKQREVQLKRKLYLRCVQKMSYTPLQPTPKLHSTDYQRLMHTWENQSMPRPG